MLTHYPYLVDPTIYADYTRRPVRVPTWATFGGTTQFATLRDLSQPNWLEELDRYTEKFGLGRVIWPTIHLLYAPHVEEAIGEVRRRGLFLFDLWGYVPDSPTGGDWSNVTPPPGMVAHLESVLGDHFLGIDNGEQDGRYIWASGEQQCPSYQSRLAQYLNFQRHFQQLCDDLGNHMTALVSLTFGHYFLKEGNHGLLGAETGQALPNSQIYYAFIRGAGKQYGVHWFGNASVWNRWGWKNYEVETRSGELFCGAEHGTSLCLLKRLLYTHYLYNCVVVGFEAGWLRKTDTPAGAQWELTPIGSIQAAAVRFVQEHGQPGVMHTPVGLLLDFFAGWAPPRHLYTSHVYQVWGGMPYAEGDYLTHAILSLLYPGYEDSSYYHDERGFLSPTPHGDMAECLLSDVPLWVLRQYGLVIAAGALTMTRELQDKLRAYVAGGGHLLITAANGTGLLPGLDIAKAPVRLAEGTTVRWADGAEDVEAAAFDLYPAVLPAGAEVLATCSERPAAVRMPHGAGAVTILLTPFGLNAVPTESGPITNAVDTPLSCPYTLLRHARRAMDNAVAAEQVFAVGEGLGFIACRKGAGEYTLGIHNNDLTARPFRIVSHCGPIRAIAELPLDQSDKGAVGYWPSGFADNDGGSSDAGNIAGGDVRLFAVTVEETGVACLPRPEPPALPCNRFLALQTGNSIKDEILARPTFFQHFDGVKVDWAYLRQRDTRQIASDQGWLSRQQVRTAVDFSRGLNLFPGLTLINSYSPHFDASKAAIDDVLEKMARCGARDAIITLHRKPENSWSDERAHDEFVSQLRDLCRRAALHGVAVRLQPHPRRWSGSTSAVLSLISEVDAKNLRLALNTGHLAMTGERLADALAAAGDRLGAVLVCAPRCDHIGQWYDAHAPVHDSGLDPSALRTLPDLLLILDAHYQDQDDEYLDVLAVEHSHGQPA